MWIIITIGILLIIYLFLIAPRMFRKPDRSKLQGVHYAHRGLFDNASDAPENSLAAIQKAVDAGYGIEFDVQLSKDDVPVVFHDATLKRMCGVDGKVWEYTLEELQKMRLLNSNESIPTFEQVLRVVKGKVPLIIEYKMDRAISKVCELGNEVLRQYNGTYCIESFHPLALIWYRRNRSDVIRGQLSENYARAGKKKLVFWIMTHLFTNVATRPDFIAYRHIDADNVERRICRALGAMSVAWTIRSDAEYRKAKSQFDLFIFDSFIMK